MQINFVPRFWLSLAGSILSLWIATECFFGFAHKVSEGKVLPLVAFIGALSFMAFLGAAVVFIYSVIGIMGNIDRMSKENVKGWEEEMEIRRVNYRKRQGGKPSEIDQEL